MVKIIYDGPMMRVNVVPYGFHEMGETKEYPDEFGRDLISTSRRQEFRIIKPPAAPPAKKPASNVRRNPRKRSRKNEKK